jgi:tRNA nucleotidyltransferase/poly(A) polymerase
MASLLSSVDELNDVRSRWKFSNPEYEMMKTILQHRDKDINLTLAKKMHIMLRIKKNLVHALLVYKNKNGAANKFQNWDAPTFPVNGEDLKRLGISPGPELGRILNSLKSKWTESGFTLGKDDLLADLN